MRHASATGSAYVGLVGAMIAGVLVSMVLAAGVLVGVLNGTTTNGLAATVADRLQQEAGYARGTTATNTDQTLQTSTVYYADGFRAQGRRVAELLSVDAVEPVTEEIEALAPDADVVVLAGVDQATQ